MLPSLRKRKDRVGLALLTGLCFYSSTGSHSDQCCYCCGYSHWHFLLAGTLKTLPWPLSFFSVCLPFFPVALFLRLSICSPSHLHRSSKCRSLPLISFSLCLSLSLSWQPHFLSAVLIAASLAPSSLIQHPPTTTITSPPPSTFSASMLPPHSALFLSLSLSNPYLSLLPALPLLSAFQTLPPLVFHFNLIHNKNRAAFRERV